MSRRIFPKSDLVRQTNLGPVKGQQCKTVYDDTYYSFEKIPFAEVPVGSLRFRSPQPKKSWSEVLDCTQQSPMPMQKNISNYQIEGSEDCLYVNIYAKHLISSKPLPVMVNIFGGGFERGDPSKDSQGPDYFMMKDLVLVTIGCRVGPLGFISFKDPQLQVPGNTGLKDQLMALNWLKENISNFNGDPNNITLFGISSGAASVHYLMLCPLAKGLFHKAILMSGTVLSPCSYCPLENVPQRLAKACGFEGPEKDEKQIFEYLQQLPAEELIKPYLPDKADRMNDAVFAFGPCVEPYDSNMCILAKHPEELLSEAWSNEIPVMIGGTSFEGLMMYGRVHVAPFVLNELDDNPQHFLPLPLKLKYSLELQKQLGMKIKSQHFGDKKAVLENAINYCDYISYKFVWHPILRTLKARLNAGNEAPTYLYRFDIDSPDFNHQRIKYCGKKMRGAAHGDDVSYTFYGNFSWKLSPETEEYKNIKRMMDILSSFAMKSNPNCGHTDKALNGKRWLPVCSNNNLQCLNIGTELEFIDLPEMVKLQLWESLYNITE